MKGKAECDACGWQHGTPGENRAFRWCRRIRGDVCDKCCKACEHNDDWHCTYDKMGRLKMRELIFTNRMEEIKIERYKSQLKHTKSPTIAEHIRGIISIIESQIEEREALYEKIWSGEINYLEKENERE